MPRYEATINWLEHHTHKVQGIIADDPHAAEIEANLLWKKEMANWDHTEWKMEITDIAVLRQPCVAGGKR